MNSLVYLLFALLPLLTGVQAGPACAARNQNSDRCIQLCQDKWGWPGHVMGSSRWGSVISSSTSDLNSALTKACRAKLSTTPDIASSVTQFSSTVDRGLESTPTLPVKVVSTVSASMVTVSSSSASSASFSVKLPTSTSSSTETSSTQNANVVSTSPLAKPLSSSTSSTRRTSPSTTSSPPSTSSTRSTPTSTSTHSTSTTTTPTSPTITKTTLSSTTTSKFSSSTLSAIASNSASSGTTSQSDINAYLQAHNSVRAQHGASPLTWSDKLAAAAQTWANKCVFQHSGGQLGPFGENLAAGTGSSYGISQAVKSWTDEVSDYNSSNPVPSHFTQVVWKATTQVGCAVQSCSGIFAASFGPTQFFVCEYSPQGNVIGQFAENVQA